MSNEITTVVAWVSRHSPLPAQIRVLRKMLGDIKVVQMSDTYRNASELSQKIKATGARYAVVVLPLSVTMHLLNSQEKTKEITYLRAEMVQASGQYNPDTDVLLDDGIGKKRHVRFKEFRILTAIEVVTEQFEVADHVK